ncbi:MAG TPA: tetratricopeptide repeat protein [Polyangiaceae bacterium]|nr:tetratricopeptide repeat protein [Polyangiaceae bacterium]
MPQRRTVEVLLDDVRWALDSALSPRELVAMLERLLREAPAGSEAALFAQRHLARLLLREQPFRAARLLREALEELPHDDELWGLLGIALTMLGQYKSAAHAHRRGLSLVPGSVTHLHNLGHLLDVGLGRPDQGLRYLAAAHRALADEEEIASSYAHALAGAGQSAKARTVLMKVLDWSAERADEQLSRWLAARSAD